MAIKGPSLQGNALNPPPPDTPTPSFSGPIRPLGSSIRHASTSSSLSPRDLIAPIDPILQAEIYTSSSRELVNLDGRESSVIDSSDDGSNQNIIPAAEAINLEKIEEVDLYITDDRARDQRYRTLKTRFKERFLNMGLYTEYIAILYIRKYSIFYPITNFIGI